MLWNRGRERNSKKVGRDGTRDGRKEPLALSVMF